MFRFKLLSCGDTNSKTIKNELETYILYLSPYKGNKFGKNVCGGASQGCINSCLFYSGYASIYPTVNKAREQKTNWLFENQVEFCKQLYTELVVLNTVAEMNSIKYAIRLNGTSDMDFPELIKKHTGKDIFLLKNLVYYDYTKILGRIKKYINQENYYLTFSRSEINEKECIEALKMGVNVSVVFKKQLPETFLGYPVINGDISDMEMTKYKSVIIGLTAKGHKAKKDTTNFVVSI